MQTKLTDDGLYNELLRLQKRRPTEVASTLGVSLRSVARHMKTLVLDKRGYMHKTKSATWLFTHDYAMANLDEINGLSALQPELKAEQDIASFQPWMRMPWIKPELNQFVVVG